MAKTKATLVSLVMVGACAFGAWKVGTCVLGDEGASSAEHFANRVWLERMPNDDRDMITHFVALDTRDGRFGALGRSSAWRHVLEVFKWHREESQLTIFFPQERQKAQFEIRTWDCRDEAPRPFELCLEFSRGERSVTFYSRYDLVVDPHAVAEKGDAAVAELVAENAALEPFARSLATIDADALLELDGEGEAADDAAAWSLLGQ
ncbi:MAG: hypothetical protein R3A79_03135 [Nannocystaceae bacterium]